MPCIYRLVRKVGYETQVSSKAQLVTCVGRPCHVRLPPRADIGERHWHVRQGLGRRLLRRGISTRLTTAVGHFRTSGDFIDRHFARDALERRALRARADAGILQQRRRLRIVDDRLAGEDRV
jgi:hypothetical protein